MDGEAGLYYYRHRVYAAELGRFVSRDPIGYEDGPDLYAYLHSKPQTGIDPTGLWSLWGDDRYLLKRCTITIFYGHGKDIVTYLKEHRIQYQTGCYYSAVVSCQSRVVAQLLPSLIPNPVLSDRDVQWTGMRKPDEYDWGPDLYAANFKAAENAAILLCKPPCCCKQVKIAAKYIGGKVEGFFKWPTPEPESKTINCAKVVAK